MEEFHALDDTWNTRSVTSCSTHCKNVDWQFLHAGLSLSQAFCTQPLQLSLLWWIMERGNTLHIHLQDIWRYLQHRPSQRKTTDRERVIHAKEAVEFRRRKLCYITFLFALHRRHTIYCSFSNPSHRRDDEQGFYPTCKKWKMHTLPSSNCTLWLFYYFSFSCSCWLMFFAAQKYTSADIANRVHQRCKRFSSRCPANLQYTLFHRAFPRKKAYANNFVPIFSTHLILRIHLQTIVDWQTYTAGEESVGSSTHLKR